jgi:hypothetical protein
MTHDHDAPFVSYFLDLYREGALPWAAFARPSEMTRPGLLLTWIVGIALIALGRRNSTYQ